MFVSVLVAGKVSCITETAIATGNRRFGSSFGSRYWEKLRQEVSDRRCEIEKKGGSVEQEA